MAYIATFAHGHMHIEKAKKRAKWSVTRTYQRLDRLHRSMGGVVSADLVKGIQTFKRKLKPEEIYQAWLKGNWHDVMEVIPWEHMKSDIGPSLERSADVIQTSGQIVIQGMPEPLRPHLRWDTKNPRVREWIASRTADNFTRLSADSAHNIQRAVTASFNQALTPRQVAQRIKNQIGLLPRHSIAVENYRSGLIAGGTSSAKAEQLSSGYADRLLEYRANMIGQTETRLATNQGQMSVWRSAADQGLVDRETTGKRWIVDGDPCEDCEPMDGMTVPLDSFFTMDDGTTVDFPPMGVHPHCFCGIEIVYDVDPDDFDQ